MGHIAFSPTAAAFTAGCMLALGWGGWSSASALVLRSRTSLHSSQMGQLEGPQHLCRAAVETRSRNAVIVQGQQSVPCTRGPCTPAHLQRGPQQRLNAVHQREAGQVLVGQHLHSGGEGCARPVWTEAGQRGTPQGTEGHPRQLVGQALVLVGQAGAAGWPSAACIWLPRPASHSPTAVRPPRPAPPPPP